MTQEAVLTLCNLLLQHKKKMEKELLLAMLLKPVANSSTLKIPSKIYLALLISLCFKKIKSPLLLTLRCLRK